MSQEKYQSNIKHLITLGKEQGYLTQAELKEHLPTSIFKPEEIEIIITMINEMNIRVLEAAPDTSEFIDTDAERIIATINAMNKVDEPPQEADGLVEIRDHSLWIKHIFNDHGLQEYLLNLKQNTLIELDVDGFRGQWVKMSDGKDGRPTNGLKPIGQTKNVWKEIQNRRGEIVSIKKV